jgi:hypothetical protein
VRRAICGQRSCRFATVEGNHRQKRPRKNRALTVRGRTALSRVTNGVRYFLKVPGVDQRSPVARRARDIARNIINDLGGVDGLSEAKVQLVRSAALISVKCEEMEAKSTGGAEIDIELYGKLTDRLGRALERLGLERQAREIPVLKDQWSPLSERTEAKTIEAA